MNMIISFTIWLAGIAALALQAATKDHNWFDTAIVLFLSAIWLMEVQS